jgi:AcrR family transcriptional regulator
MRAIADGLGVSAMAPYRYFENKAEIFALVRADAFRRFADGQERAFAAVADPMGRLFAMRDEYVRFALGHADEYRIMFDLDQEPEDQYPQLARENHRSFETLKEAVRLAVEAGIMRGDPSVVAHQAWATLHGMISLHLAGKLTMGCSLEELLAAPPMQFVLE